MYLFKQSIRDIFIFCNLMGIFTRVVTGPVELVRPAGFCLSKEISKLIRDPRQGQLKNEFYNFVDIQFFHNNICREKV